MARGTLGLHEVDGVAIEHMRSALLKLLVKVQISATQLEVEKSIKFLIEQIDWLEQALDISKKQIQLPLEPVNAAEVSDQVLHKLSLAGLPKNVVLQSTFIRKTPVLAHRKSLARSLESMILAVIDSAGATEKVALNITAPKFPAGFKLGVYSESLSFGATEFRAIKNNIGKVARPSSSLSPSSLAHLYIADVLLGAMGADFRTSINERKKGVATILPYSNQLQLINI